MHAAISERCRRSARPVRRVWAHETAMGWRAPLKEFVDGRIRRPVGMTWYLAAPVLLVVLHVGDPLPSATSVVAATGLGVLAVTDARMRRLPRPVVRALAATLALTLTVSCAVQDAWAPLLHAVSWATGVGLALGLLWWLVPNVLAFGDVKITTLAAAAAAAVSWRSVAVMLLLSCLASAGYAAFTLLQKKAAPAWDMTIPFAPGLAVGFVAAVSLS